MRVGYLGPAGTYSEEALRASASGAVDEVPFPAIRDAVMAVQERTVERAVVPIENALEGSVAVTLETLVTDAPDVRIASELVHPIRHCLVARSELALDSVRRVVSHPQATAQCARFLRERLPGAERVLAPSTADAVRSLRDDDSSAALGSRLAAELYGCVVLADDAGDHPDNSTRFVWLARAEDALLAEGPGAKTTVVFWGGGDRSPGWLAAVLGELASRGVNLTRIESRPRRTVLGHYMFFADLEGGAGQPPVSEALAALAGHVDELRVLGSYPSSPG